MSSDRELLVYKAKLAEQADRYEDMVEIMKELGEKPGELSDEERNMFSVAFKNTIGTRRTSWRSVSNFQNKHIQVEHMQVESSKAASEQASEYIKKIEKELDDICADVTKFLEEKMIPKASTTESKVFYYKMKGDYWRYKAEYRADDECIKNSEEAYETATGVAEKELSKTNPTRLGLALNFSVFYYEIKRDPSQACSIAKEAFDNAINELDQLREEHYKDSTLIMQLLRDNLTLWTLDAEDED